MARMILIDINANDELPAVIRKCNDNFRRMSSQQSRDTDLSVRLEGERSDAALAEAMAGMAAALSEMRTWVEQAIEGLRTWVVAEIAKMTQPKLFAPPVGTYLHCEQNPSATWSGTVWTQVASGNYLVSAGAGYPSGSSVGSNQVTLVEANLPKLSGNVWNMAQQSRNVPVTADGICSARPRQDTASGYGATAHEDNPDVDSSIDGFTVSFGGGLSHENRPQSICVPLWKRTA